MADDGDTSKATKREWLATIWPVVAAVGWIAFGAVWFGGRLDTTVSVQQRDLIRVQADIDKLHDQDIGARQALSNAVDERNRLLTDLERRLSEKRDVLNEGLAEAKADNKSTRDMLMMMERRLEAVEARH